MPNHKSAEKRVKTAQKARLVNRIVRSEIRTSLKKVRGPSPEEALKELPRLFSLLDKAARKNQGGFTKNSASNYKRKAQLAVTGKKPEVVVAKPPKAEKAKKPIVAEKAVKAKKPAAKPAK